MTARRRRLAYRTALGAVLFATAAVLVALGRREYIGYDSYWHVFIARQDRWPNFWREVRENAHPPLFYFALRAASNAFGAGLLTYRLVSIASTVTATAVVAGIVRRTTANLPLAILAAAAFGLSYGAIMVGLEVRAYAMCALFTLLAFQFYLDWLNSSSRRPAMLASGGFAAAATAAVLTHYSTFFFLAAALATPLGLATMSRAWRRRLAARIRLHPVSTAAMFGVPIAVAAAAYVVHVTLWGGGRLGHVPSFMFNPDTESALGFVVRNTLNVAAIVLPGGNEFISGIYNSIQRIALTLLGGVALVGLAQLGRRRSPRLAAVPIVMLLVMTGLNVIAGLTDRYPYGGAARHEFFLVPFVLLGWFTLLEVVRRGLPRVLAARRTVAAVVACGVAASITSWAVPFRVEPIALFQPTMDLFRRTVAAPRAVLVDRFSFINFFSHYHDWQWRAGDEWPGQAVRQLWSVTSGGRRMVICRDDSQWSFDMTDVSTYDSVIECGQRAGVSRVAMFRTHWWDSPGRIAVFDRALAADNGVTATAMATVGNDIVAEFEVDPAVLHDCAAAPPTPPDLHVVANRDHVVTLAWSAVGTARTTYIMEAGLRSGGIDALNLPVGRTTTYTATRVNAATYYARVRAKNTCGVSPPSPEVVVVVP